MLFALINVVLFSIKEVKFCKLCSQRNDTVGFVTYFDFLGDFCKLSVQRSDMVGIVNKVCKKWVKLYGW